MRILIIGKQNLLNFVESEKKKSIKPEVVIKKTRWYRTHRKLRPKSPSLCFQSSNETTTVAEIVHHTDAFSLSFPSCYLRQQVMTHLCKCSTEQINAQMDPENCSICIKISETDTWNSPIYCHDRAFVAERKKSLFKRCCCDVHHMHYEFVKWLGHSWIWNWFLAASQVNGIW